MKLRDSTLATMCALLLAASAGPAQAQIETSWGGRVQVDQASFDGVYSDNGSRRSPTYLRRASLEGRLRWHPQWRADGEIEIDSDGRLRLETLAVAWTPQEGLRLRAGRLDPDFGLEPSTSSSWTFGVERSAVWDLAPDLDDGDEGAGLRVDAYRRAWNASAGVYDQGERRAVVARGVWRPLWPQGGRATGRLHLGASAAWRFDARDDGRIRTRLGVRGVSEDRLGRRSVLAAALPAPGNYDEDQVLGVEAAWQQGRLLVQAEALQRRLSGNGGAPGRDAQGAYALVAWSLTGEPRRYDEDRGRWRGAQPAGGRWGAWEVFYRLDELGVSGGGDARVHTVGLGWTAAQTWRALLNLHHARSDDANALGQTTGVGLSARLQATF